MSRSLSLPWLTRPHPRAPLPADRVQRPFVERAEHHPGWADRLADTLFAATLGRWQSHALQARRQYEPLLAAVRRHTEGHPLAQFQQQGVGPPEHLGHAVAHDAGTGHDDIARGGARRRRLCRILRARSGRKRQAGYRGGGEQGITDILREMHDFPPLKAIRPDYQVVLPCDRFAALSHNLRQSCYNQTG